jgi:hypothetical protein
LLACCWPRTARAAAAAAAAAATEIYAEMRQTVRLTRAQVLALVGFWRP